MIVPAYNAARFLATAVDSALRQGVDLEVIVVDDGSTDRTPQVASSLPVRYIRQGRRRGPGAARNRGLEAARGELIAFLDADDEWLPGKLAAQLELRQRLGRPCLIYTDEEVIDEGGAPLRRKAKEGGSGQVFEGLFRRNFICTSSVLVDRECLRAVGPFDEALSLSQDYDLWLRIAHRFEFHRVPGAMVRRRAKAHLPTARLYRTRRNLIRIALRWRGVVSEELLRRRVSDLYIGWARIARRRGDPQTARRCAHLALRYTPWRAKAWREVVRCHR